MDQQEHGLVVKTHWKRQAEGLRKQMQDVPKEAEKQKEYWRTAEMAGVYRALAGMALRLLDEVLQAAEDAQGKLPIRLLFGKHLIVDGKQLRVVDAVPNVDDPGLEPGRTVWEIVTEEPAEEPHRADATADAGE